MNPLIGPKNMLIKIPREVRYVLLLFVITRVVLLLIGDMSRVLLPESCHFPHTDFFSGRVSLDIWGEWDSGLYLKNAEELYPPHLEEGKSNYGFFPLYPSLIKILGMVIGSNLIAGIVISNICLIMAAILLYRLVLLSSDEDAAMRSVKYLFLFPFAFILSGVLSEALFLLMAIICFYCARTGKWLLCGAAGYLVSLTRSNGVLLLLPVAWEYFRSKDYKLRNIRADVLWLALIPLGLATFSGYCWLQTGNWRAYEFAKRTGWHLAFSNPQEVLRFCLRSRHDLPLYFNGILCVIIALLLTAYGRRIGFAYWLYGMMFVVLALAYGMGDAHIARLRAAHSLLAVTSMHGMGRFAVDIFPLYIILGRASANDTVDRVLTAGLALLQGGLMVFWCVGSPIVV